MKRKRSLSVEGLLGKGSYGTVYKVSYDNTLYACKILKHDNELDLTDFFKASFREIFFGNFVGIISDAKDMILGGLLELGLASFRTCKVSENALRNLYDICVQLKDLHKAGIIHHDIKPDNIILYGNRHELADFSLSFRCPVVADTNVYTIWYRAPEILLGHSHTAKADIWALGMTFLHLILGRPVFRETTIEGALVSIVRIFGTQGYTPLVQRFGEHPGCLKGLVSKDMYTVLERMLRVNPGLRISSSDLVQDPFWTGKKDSILFWNTDTSTSESLSYEVSDVPVYFKRVPVLIRVRIFDIFVKACDVFKRSKRVLLTAFYFWDTIKPSGMPWYAACFFAAVSLECECVDDLYDIASYFHISTEALVSALYVLPTLTRAPVSLDLDDDEGIYGIVGHSSCWFGGQNLVHSETALRLTKTRATFLVL